MDAKAEPPSWAAVARWSSSETNMSPSDTKATRPVFFSDAHTRTHTHRSMHKHADKHCSDMRAGHGCVIRPRITEWETWIVCTIDASFSLMKAAFCQKPLSPLFIYFFLCPTTTTFGSWMGAQRRPSPGSGLCWAIMLDLHLILGYDRLPHCIIEPRD